MGGSAATQSGPTWGLDRIDQANLPIDQRYTYPNTASTVTAYVLDSGIFKEHGEFGGRVRHGWDFVDNDTDASDCNGHGTHMAGAVGSRTYGVAKRIRLVSVRVLDCLNTGQNSLLIKAVDWVAQRAARPAVANVSISSDPSTAVDDAVRRGGTKPMGGTSMAAPHVTGFA